MGNRRRVRVREAHFLASPAGAPEACPGFHAEAMADRMRTPHDLMGRQRREDAEDGECLAGGGEGPWKTRGGKQFAAAVADAGGKRV